MPWKNFWVSLRFGPVKIKALHETRSFLDKGGVSSHAWMKRGGNPFSIGRGQVFSAKEDLVSTSEKVVPPYEPGNDHSEVLVWRKSRNPTVEK